MSEREILILVSIVLLIANGRIALAVARWLKRKAEEAHKKLDERGVPR